MRKEFALLRHQSESCTSLRMSVYLFHIPVTSHVVQLLKGNDLVFWNFWGLDKFCASRSVWDGMAAHTENVHAQHARDHSRSGLIPVMKKEHGEKKRIETFAFSLQVC